MNEFNRFSYNKQVSPKEKKKKILLIGISFCIVLIIALAFLIIHFTNVDAKTFKLYIDDTQVNISEGFYIVDDQNHTYVRAKDIAEYIGWNYQNGEYGSYTEDLNSGYISNEYEAASFVVNSNILKKYIVVTAEPEKDDKGNEYIPYEPNSEEGTLETTTLSLPVISKDNQIYFPLESLRDICNCNIEYSNQYRMYIYEQQYLLSLAQSKAAEYGYQSISGTYENMRALAYGMMVVSNKGGLFGVSSIYSNETIIGLKYSDMIFAQNVKEFFVKTSTGDDENLKETIGIIGVDGSTVISPKDYGNIQVLSDSLGLYLVEKDGEYGVLDRQGEVVVHCEYDSIGLPEELLTQFNFSVEDNRYMLFDDCLIVEKDGKYGIYDTDGNQNLPTGYSGFGYLVESDPDSPRNAEDLLMFEVDDLDIIGGDTRNIRGIVVQQEHEDGTITYGLYDAESKKILLPANVFTRIYSVTSRGDTEYYSEFPGQTAKIVDQISNHPELFE